MRRCSCKTGGLCLISMGIGVLLALVLPAGVILFVSGLTLIVLGATVRRI